MESAMFAAGCFWGVQYYFDHVPGVVKTEAGYTGGHTKNPTYDEVVRHTTGHTEAVKITFDPAKVSYHDLLVHFFRIHDPTQLNRQGPNIGDNYRSAIFYTSEVQKKATEQIIQELTTEKKFNQPIVTQVVKAGDFYVAEPFQQKFTQRTGIGFCGVDYAPV